MRKRRIVELGLVLLCTNLMLVAATVPDQIRDARSAVAERGFASLSAAGQAPTANPATPGVAQSVVTPKTLQVQTPDALKSAAPPASPAASKSSAVMSQTSIVKTAIGSGTQRAATPVPANDDCANAYYFYLYAGSPVTFYDDNTGATEDCALLSGGAYREAWYKFTTVEQLNVVVKYCGTSPAFYNAYIVMDTVCPCSGAWIFASSYENTSCGDGNWTLNWAGLPAGTYYWPLLTDSAGGYAEGPYTVTFDTTIPPPPEECPEGITLFGQTPTDQSGAWGAYTSGVGPSFEYTVADNFWGVTDKIGDIHWWGLSLFFDPYYGWLLCDPTGMTFEIKFYQDNAGYPGNVVCSYVEAPTITQVGPFSWAILYYFSVDQLQPCCVLDHGWVSVKSQAHPAGCVFLWLNSPFGDLSSYQMPAGGAWGQLGTDLSFCLTTGECPLYFGACCDDYTGVCNDDVEWGDCMPPLRFTQDTLCADISPTCGIRGACCDAGLVCIFTGFESECDAVSGRFFPGETCPEWVCPEDCEHRIDLWDCYGDGWNGNTLDLLVNGVTVLSQITLPSGAGPAVYYFMAATGDTIQTIYYPIGGWPYEPYYYVYDGFGTLIGLDGIVGSDCYVQPTGITCTGNCNAPTDGACCYFAGGCDMVPSASECIDGEWLGLGHQCFECPCYVVCPPEGIPEAEPCGADTNGGCNAAGWPFEPIACNTTICGTMWADTALRDTDWYQLTLTEAQYLTWTAESQVPLLIFIIQGAGPSDCSSYTILGSATAGECQPASLTVEGSAGVTYWFWAGPSAWADWPCDKDYTASLICAPVPTGACCLPNGDCIEINPSGCAAQSGIYQGDYVSCANVVCEPFYCQAGATYCDEYISRVQVGAIDNPSGCGAGQYEDYTYLSADLPLGVGTPMIVTNGNPIWTSDTCTYWIDWNHDYVFDDTTETSADIVGVGPYNFVITPPTTALFGPTRMRIRIDYANADPDPCGITSYGEVEDYTVNVLEVPGACCMPDGYCFMALPSECTGYWGGPFTECSYLDCNDNGADDFCDIASGYSEDCDGNGVPDECQTWFDCNNNGIPDFCDIASGDSQDCNANGFPDECDVPPLCEAGQPGFPEVCSLDCQPDLIPDECQLEGPPQLYAYDDGTHENSIGLTAGGYVGWMVDFVVTGGAGNISKVDIAYGMVTDGSPVTIYLWSDPNNDGNPTDGQVLASANAVTANGDLDVFNEVAIGPANVGGDGTHFFPGAIIQHTAGQYPCSLDQTSSAGKSWICGGSTPLDPNNLGAAELPPLVIDTYFPGNWLVRAEAGGGGADCNGNGIPDFCDVPPPCGNCEGPNCSQDCNGDCVPDECQLGCGDCNGNGRPDDCDITSGTSLDCNGNGIPDECDLDPTDPDCNGQVSPDCQGNGIPDECELEGNDCNNNGIPDECDIAAGSCDCQGDGIPDECQLWTEARDILLYDDGSSENSLGGPPAICWVHHFVVAEPCTVMKIMTCFGTPLYPGSSGVTPGMPFEVFVWTDPNGDGDPLDAVLLGRQGDTVDAGSIDTDVFQVVELATPVAGVSGSFFIGAAAQNAGSYPGPMDENGVLDHQSWVTFNSLPYDPTVWLPGNTYFMDTLGYPADWLLRAEVSFVPPPNDCNENGIPDECDIGVEWGGFCEGQGGCWPTDCESDWNSNGIPDSCELGGDLNGDGLVNYDDYWVFLDAFGTCVGDPKYVPAADMDGDGCITLVDYRAWRMFYKMANGEDFVPPKPKPMPMPAPTKAPKPGVGL